MSADELETLRHLQTQQREELQYRRAREFQIFTWSVTLLLAVIAAVLVKPPDVLAKSGVVLRVVASVIVVGLTFYSLYWQLYQRKSAAAHARVLAKIAGKLGVFDPAAFDGPEPLYPDHWRGWGERYLTFREQLSRPSKMSATFLVGIIAMVSLWL
jgi:hypothetical protein